MTDHVVRDRIIKETESYGLKLRHFPDLNRSDWIAHCSKCNCEAGKHFPTGTAPEAILMKFRKSGWTLSQKYPPLCVTCTGKAGWLIAKKREQKNMKDDINPAIMRKVFEYLQENFDEENKRFRGVHSDTSCANSCGTSVAVVIGLRKGAYGDLAPSPEIVEWTKRLTALEGDADALRRMANELVGNAALLREQAKKFSV